jgi:ferredoxin
MTHSTGTATTGRTIEIDWTRCDGHGLCAAALPTHIGRDEWGFPILHGIDRADDADLRRVVNVCPALALRLRAT